MYKGHMYSKDDMLSPLMYLDARNPLPRITLWLLFAMFVVLLSTFFLHCSTAYGTLYTVVHYSTVPESLDICVRILEELIG
jgi:hypothetical protein